MILVVLIFYHFFFQFPAFSISFLKCLLFLESSSEDPSSITIPLEIRIILSTWGRKCNGFVQSALVFLETLLVYNHLIYSPTHRNSLSLTATYVYNFSTNLRENTARKQFKIMLQRNDFNGLPVTVQSKLLYKKYVVMHSGIENT